MIVLPNGSRAEGTVTLSLETLLRDIGLLALAFALALPIGWERQQAQRPAGLRTFPIVALASCAFVLLGQVAFAGSESAQARLVQGLMTGIGFIGGGAILKDSRDDGGGGYVEGIATAASIWNTGAIGAAIAFRRLEIAVTLSLTNYVILRLFSPPARGEEDDGSDTPDRDERDRAT